MALGGEPPADVVAHAAVVRALVAEVSPQAEVEVQRWLAHREALVQQVAQEDRAAWAEVAYLDRLAATGASPAQASRLLDAASAAAISSGDSALQQLVAIDAALLQARSLDGPRHEELRRRAEALLEALEAQGHTAAAAAGWRAMALASRGGGDEFVALVRSARLHQQIGQPLREALLLIEAARSLGPHHDDADEVLARARTIVEPSQHTVLRALVADTMARFAAARGQTTDALPLARQAMHLATGTELEPGTRVLLGDLLVAVAGWSELAQVAGRGVELAERPGDPHLAAVSRRHLGLALVEQGRFDEGAALLQVVLDAAQRGLPELVGPTGWALGKAREALGELEASRAAYAAAAAGFLAQGRRSEAAQAQFAAGERAWDAGELDAADEHFATAAGHARASADLWLLAAAGRGTAALRMVRGELTAGLADLDAVSSGVAAHAADLGHLDAHEWPDRLFVSVMRQGAVLLAAGGQPQAAAARCAAAAEVSTGIAALILTCDQGRFLAEAGKARGARRLLEETLPHLFGEDLDPIRIENAAAWARTLEADGRAAEAELVWRRFGPDATDLDRAEES